MDQKLPIEFTLATSRSDGGKTPNYCVYECTRQMQVKNGRGEDVVKNAIMGGNGSIYIGHELAGSHANWVLMPKAMYDRMAGAGPDGSAGSIDKAKPAAKKGKK